jgi:hypothetical protein
LVSCTVLSITKVIVWANGPIETFVLRLPAWLSCGEHQPNQI